jgi:hypothetical protein
MKLTSLNLEVLNIHRKGIFDMNAMAFCCDNCGRAIVNSATVKDIESGNIYVIGLDCKKTLIDKKVINRIIKENDDYIGKHKVKEYKREQADIQQVAMYLDNPNRYDCRVDKYGSQYLTVYDNTKTDVFGNLGLTVFSESLGYLFKIGLKDLLQSAVNKGIIKPQ